LPRQHGFLAILVGANDERAKLAMTIAVAADHLLLGKNGVSEDGVGGRGHCAVPLTKLASSVMLDH
jgi:hypothetical protein